MNPVRIERWSKRSVTVTVRGLVGDGNRYIPDWKQLEKNAKRNAEAGRPFEKCRSGSLVIVGSGSSWDLHSTVPSAETLAVGTRAATLLNATGRTPDWLFLVNPKVTTLPRARNYLLGTQCDRSLFRRYPTAMRFEAQAGAGGGVMASKVAADLGYTDLHLVGMDSSGEGPLTAVADGRQFKTTPLLWGNNGLSLTQYVQSLHDRGCSVTVHGDGLLQHVLRGMYREPDSPPDTFSHNFGVACANFDFMTTLVNARMTADRLGYKGTLRLKLHGDPAKFQATKMAPEHMTQMFHHVLRPLMRLFNVVEDPELETDRVYSASYCQITEAVRAGEDVPRVRVSPVEIRNPKRISITLREAEYGQPRNSNIPAWCEFARRRISDGFEVVFIRDTAKAGHPLRGFETYPLASTDLIERTRFYESCACNLGIANGPMSLLWFSDNPFINVVPLHHYPGYEPALPQWWTSSAAITPPEQFPWFRDDQRIEWGLMDTVENLETCWNHWQARKTVDRLAA